MKTPGIQYTQPYKDDNQQTLRENTGLKWTGTNGMINRTKVQSQILTTIYICIVRSKMFFLL